MTAETSGAAASLIIIVAGRERHLRNLLRGVAQSSVRPAEIIVVAMGGGLRLESDELLKVIDLPDAGDLLPLAAARNAGAAAVGSACLVFLDVDCVPATDFLATITGHVAATGGLVMGTPRYLTQPIGEPFSMAELAAQSTPHPAQPVLQTPCQPTEDYHLFWSNCFAISASDFQRIGGFDPCFQGYGGEDTDFAFTARKLRVPFARSAATVYHQPHASLSPPVNHLVAIVNNANLFYRKWQRWPMEGWLAEFRQRGLISWNLADGVPIELLNSSEKAG